MNEDDSRYEGLNLPQLLDLMHGIEIPDPVSMMPQTVGWIVLTVWLMAICLLMFLRWLSARRRNRYRRAALDALKAIDISTAHAAAEIATIVKRTALAAYPRAEVASLSGASWAQFLIRTADGERLVAQSAPLLARAAYTDDVNAAEILEPARRWVARHRA